MLPSSPEVEEVYFGEGGLAEGIEELEADKRAETLFIDCTTLDQNVAKDVAGRISGLGASMIDAPVSGGELETRLAAVETFTREGG